MTFENSFTQQNHKTAGNYPPVVALEDESTIDQFEPRSGLLASAGPRDHIAVQLYQGRESLPDVAESVLKRSRNLYSVSKEPSR